ncbi:MAG: hypothetical protein DRI84_05975 [Bacteroidetes bacterium]|nr:MAG: hypothetical protein DRI84_05975 [Bacteroidota bacterium]
MKRLIVFVSLIIALATSCKFSYYPNLPAQLPVESHAGDDSTTISYPRSIVFYKVKSISGNYSYPTCGWASGLYLKIHQDSTFEEQKYSDVPNSSWLFKGKVLIQNDTLILDYYGALRGEVYYRIMNIDSINYIVALNKVDLFLDKYERNRAVFSDSVFTNPKDKARTKLNYLNNLCFIRCEYFNE